MTEYESPIDVIVGEFEMKMEGDIMKSVQRVGINVDKKELLKALEYDRGQFEKGYLAAKKKYERPHGEWIVSMSNTRCSNCGYNGKTVETTNFCPNCGAKMGGEAE